MAYELVMDENHYRRAVHHEHFVGLVWERVRVPLEWATRAQEYVMWALEETFHR